MRPPEAAGAILDMDGTLLDTMGAWEAAPMDLLRERGVTCTERMAAAFHGLGFEAAAEHISQAYLPDCRPEELMEEIVARLHRFYREAAPAKPGAEDLLRRLAGRRIPMAILTSNRRELACAALDRMGWRKYFRFILSARECGMTKSDPELFRLAAERLEAPPERCLVFEDSLAPAKAAAATGMRVMAVLDQSSRADWPALRALAEASARDPGELIF